MKIRNCFVSNSSSSSFCLWGVAMSTSQYEEEFEVRLSDSASLTYCYGLEDYSGKVVVGVSPGSMGEEETLGQLKARIAGELNEIIGRKAYRSKDVLLHIDGGYDG